MTYTDIQNAVKFIVKTVGVIANDNVIPQNDNGPRPETGVYVTFNIDSDIETGRAIVNDTNKTTRVQTIDIYNTATISLNAYRDGAIQELKTFASKLKLDTNKLIIKKAYNLTILEPLNVDDLTFLQDTTFTERGLLTLRIEYVNTISETLSTIDDVEITNNYELN